MNKFRKYTKQWIIHESVLEKEKRARKILYHLKKKYPKAKLALNYKNHIQLLVAVILSAQCTDKKVNEVTDILFKKYKTPKDFANANQAIFEKEIRQTGFFRNKARNIISSAQIIDSKYNGKLPKRMEEILLLPGVARKTANIVLGNTYGIVEGIAVDTHVGRLAQRFGLTNSDNPRKIELNLMELFPKKEWLSITYKIIDHGRAVCTGKRKKVRNLPT